MDGGKRGGSNRYPRRTDRKKEHWKELKGKPERETPMEEENPYLIEGRNPVREALKAGRPLDKILVARGVWDGSVRQIVGIAKERRIVVQEVDRSRLDEISVSGNHQGLIAYGAAHEYVELEDILEGARERGEDPFLIVLDGISDPHNLGSILRTAECCGAHGVVIPKRRAVGLTPTVAKASSGAVEYIPVARVTNIGVTLETLKKQGIWIAGADVTGEAYYRADLIGPLALVIGSEGEGMSRLVREKCDFLVSIPLRGNVESLNASVAAGILMYEITKRRIEKITR